MILSVKFEQLSLKVFFILTVFAFYSENFFLFNQSRAIVLHSGKDTRQEYLFIYLKKFIEV